MSAGSNAIGAQVLFMDPFREPSVVRLLSILCAADFLFVVLHFARLVLKTYWESKFIPWDFDLEKDGGFPEWYGYAKTAATAWFFALAYWRSRALVYASWALICLVVLLDDSLEVHERLGEFWADTWQIVKFWGLRSRDVGELIVWACLGAVVFGPLAYGFTTADARDRRISNTALAIFAGLAGFAVVGDLLHRIFKKSIDGADTVLTALEDGGELVMLSVFCAYACGIAIFYRANGGRAPDRNTTV